jgi:CRP-like cAMP-binding protein
MEEWTRLAESGLLGPKLRAPDRASIWESGCEAAVAYFLRGGAVEVFQRAEDGASIVVRIVLAPAMIGVIEPLAGEARYLESVRAAGEAELHAMSRERFGALLESNPRASYQCMVDMSRAFCAATRFESAKLAEPEALLANLFDAYGEVFGEREAGRVRLGLRRTQAELAQSIGAAERSISRIIADWKRELLVEKLSGRYLIHRPDEIARRAGELRGSLVHRSKEGISARPTDGRRS